MKATDQTLPMPTTQELYDMFKELNDVDGIGNNGAKVPFTNTGFYADQLQDFYEANERPISYTQAKQIARKMCAVDRKHRDPLYKQEIKIMDSIRRQFRGQLEYACRVNFKCYRTFSEARSGGRRLKFWGCQLADRSTGRVAATDVLATAAQFVQARLLPGLQVAGWQMWYKIYSSGSYNSLNVMFGIERIGS